MTTAAEVRAVFRDRLGVRIGPETAGYVLRRLAAGAAAAAAGAAGDGIPVMGGDARTGVPVRRVIDPAALAAAADPSPAPAH